MNIDLGDGGPPGQPLPKPISPRGGGTRLTDAHHFQRVAPNACRSHVESHKNRPERATELLTELLWTGPPVEGGRLSNKRAAGPGLVGERLLREFARATRSPRAGRGCGQPERALRRSGRCPPRSRPRARARAA